MKDGGLKYFAVACLAAWVTSAGLYGKTEPSQRHTSGPTVIGGANARKLEDPLDRGIAIWADEESLAALVAWVKPTFVLGNRSSVHLVWAGKDSKGRAQFTVREAFVYQLEGTRPRWVLVCLKAGEKKRPRQLWGTLYHAVCRNCKKKPMHDHGEGYYTVVLSRDPRHGWLYRIGWEAYHRGGTGRLVRNWGVFALQNKNGRWRLVARAVPTASWKSGWICHNISADYRIKWLDMVGEPVQIAVTIRRWTSETGEGANGDWDLMKYRDGVLLGAPTFGVKWTSNCYLRSRNGDMLDDIAARLARWDAGRPGRSAEAFARWKQLQQRWRRTLVQLNPKLPDGRIPKNTRIQLPENGKLPKGKAKPQPEAGRQETR